MSGISFGVDWDDERFQRQLKGIQGNIADMGPVMADFSEHVLLETMERFEREEAPDGSGWQTLSPITQKMREKEGSSGKILQRDGRLKNSIQGEWDESGSGLASTNVIYAAIHNFGGTIVPKKGKALKFGNITVASVEIPRRQYMGFSEDDFDYFNESVAGWIVTGKVG